MVARNSVKDIIKTDAIVLVIFVCGQDFRIDTYSPLGRDAVSLSSVRRSLMGGVPITCDFVQLSIRTTRKNLDIQISQRNISQLRGESDCGGP